MMKKRLSKTQKVAIDILLIAVMVILFVAVLGRTGSDQTTKMSQIVAIENGKVVSQPITNSFELKTGGKQVIAVKWWPEENPGFVTGLVIKDPEGNRILACTGDKVDMVSHIMKLQKGTYEIMLTFLASKEEMVAFSETYNLGEIIGEEFTDYAEDGEWRMEYTIEFRNAVENKTGLSLLLGVVTGLLLVRLFLVISKKEDESEAKYGEGQGSVRYDERQELVRGRAYTYGFFTFSIYNGIMSILSMGDIPIPAEQGVLFFVGIVIAGAVMITYSIWKDGYFALNENRKTLLIIFCIVTIINFVGGMNGLHMGTVMRDGRLALGSMNFFCCGLFLYIFILLVVKSLMDKREDKA